MSSFDNIPVPISCGDYSSDARSIANIRLSSVDCNGMIISSQPVDRKQGPTCPCGEPPVRHRVVKHGADIKNAFTLDLAHHSVVSAKIRDLIIETTRRVTGTEHLEADPSADLSFPRAHGGNGVSSPDHLTQSQLSPVGEGNRNRGYQHLQKVFGNSFRPPKSCRRQIKRNFPIPRNQGQGLW